MNPKDYQYIAINGVDIAYTDRGAGRPILFVHGFASFTFTWLEVISLLPADELRILTIDLKGYGYSEKRCDDYLSPFDQAVIVTEFIKRFDLKDLTLIGHSMGAAISILTLANEEMRKVVTKLVLIDGAGLFQKLPDFIDELQQISLNSPLIKMVKEESLATMVLDEVFYDDSLITPKTVEAYAHVLKQKNAIQCLIAAAKQIAIADLHSFKRTLNALTIPALILWGEEDAIIDVEDAFQLSNEIKDSELRIIPSCGHSPQEEAPLETAKHIASFLGVELVEDQIDKSILAKKTRASDEAAPQNDRFESTHGVFVRKLKMSRLIDRWSFGTVILIVIIKFLQFLKKLGLKAKSDGWRKVTGVFLRNEHSKFVLTNFRLKPYATSPGAPSFNEAKTLVIKRFMEFLRHAPDTHWTVEWGYFMVKRKKMHYTDIVDVEFDKEGWINQLTPHFDDSRKSFPYLTEDLKIEVYKEFVDACNEFRHISGHKRAWMILKRLRRWSLRKIPLSFAVRIDLRHMVERMLDATYMQFHRLEEDPETLNQRRLTTPNFKNHAHPGFGLLNIVARFTHDLSEVDFWVQHHHVPVDGQPMQELLREMKEQWGTAGVQLYPALNSPAARPEIFYFGSRIFRARLFVDFESFLETRNRLNKKYFAEMGGNATVPSLLIWGIAHHAYFRHSKFVLPIDTSILTNSVAERNLSLFFIRPSEFFNTSYPLEGFFRFQREFNQRLFATRLGKSESNELLDLYAMIHPFFYHASNFLMPKAMREFVGTAGLTILKDAEMFVSPLTDLNTNGFIALGNMKNPTEDGKTAGAVSICGSRPQIRHYIEAIQEIIRNYEQFLGEANR